MERTVEDHDERLWSRLRIAGWTGAALIILVPAIAMQFTDEVAWTLSDFVFAAIVVGGTGLVFELALRRSVSGSYRLGTVFALAASFLIIWISGAVGIIGNEGNPANLMYVAVLGTAVIGALASRFRARPLALAMTATAAVHAIVTVVALTGVIGHPVTDHLRPFLMNAFFLALWLLSAALFRRAAESGT